MDVWVGRILASIAAAAILAGSGTVIGHDGDLKVHKERLDKLEKQQVEALEKINGKLDQLLQERR